MKGDGELYATDPVDGYPDLVSLVKIQMGMADMMETATEIKRLADSGVLYRMPSHTWLIDLKNQLELNHIIKNGEVNLSLDRDGDWVIGR